MIKLISRLEKTVRNVENILLIILMSCMVILGTMQIVSRFVLKSPITWSEALLTYMFIYTAFIGSSVALAEKSHFVVDIFTNLFPKWVQRFIDKVVNILLFVCVCIIVYKGFIIVDANQTQEMSALPFSMSWPYLALPLSGVFMGIHLLYQLFENEKQIPEVNTTNEELDESEKINNNDIFNKGGEVA